MPSHGFKLKRCQGCHTVWEAADFKPGTDLCWRCWDAAHPIKRQDSPNPRGEMRSSLLTTMDEALGQTRR